MNAPLEAAGQMAIFVGTFLLGKFLPELIDSNFLARYLPEFFDSKPPLRDVLFWIISGPIILALAWNVPQTILPPQIQIVSILLFWIGVGVWASAERKPDERPSGWE